MGKRILCVDFDGVLHSYDSGWTRADEVNDGPVPGAIEFLRKAVEVFDVAIFSSRTSHQGGVVAMRAALRDWGADGKLLDQLTFPTQKPPAFLTLDDRALRFDGVFPEPAALLGFKPWNRRE